MSSASEIQNLAMKLPERSRLKLAGELLCSVAPSHSPDEVLEEAKRRDGEIDRGLVKPLSETEFWSALPDLDSSVDDVFERRSIPLI